MKRIVLAFAVFIFLMNLVNADVVSVNSGGSEKLAITPDKFTGGFFFPQICGNNLVETGEQCDDGNTNSGDGCSSTCTTETTSSGDDSSGEGGGGSGGGGVAAITKEIENLTPIPNSINLPATSGINTSTKLSLRNDGNKTLDVELSASDFEGNIEFDRQKISILPGETITIAINIIPPENPGTYSLKIIINSLGRKTEIPFALNVNSELSLFDITLEIPDKYRIINIGETILSQITLIQAGLQENRDVQMEYEVKDFNGNTYFKETETIAVFREKTFQKEFDTSSLNSGEYLATAAVIYSGGVATSSSQFTVEPAGIEKTFNYVPIAVLLIAVVVLIILLFIAKNYKRKR